MYRIISDNLFLIEFQQKETVLIYFLNFFFNFCGPQKMYFVYSTQNWQADCIVTKQPVSFFFMV